MITVLLKEKVITFVLNTVDQYYFTIAKKVLVNTFDKVIISIKSSLLRLENTYKFVFWKAV